MQKQFSRVRLAFATNDLGAIVYVQAKTNKQTNKQINKI